MISRKLSKRGNWGLSQVVKVVEWKLTQLGFIGFFLLIKTEFESGRKMDRGPVGLGSVGLVRSRGLQG